MRLCIQTSCFELQFSSCTRVSQVPENLRTSTNRRIAATERGPDEFFFFFVVFFFVFLHKMLLDHDVI